MVQINDDQRHHVTVLDEQNAQTGVAQLEFSWSHSSIVLISSLPEEVLVMVFEAGTQEQGTGFAVLVSHVTRSWRNIALATPRLWATIRCVKPNDMGKPYPETVKKRTTAFLTRSRSLPVEIYIRHCFTAEDRRFLQVISKHFGRCQHFSIGGMGLEELSAVLTHFSHQPAPLLESFAFEPAQGRFLQLEEPLFPSGVPRLITAQINLFDFHSFHFCLPAFQSLTSLRLTSIYIDHRHNNTSYSSLREGLMALPFLTHLELQEAHVQVDLPCQPVVLPALQVLHTSSSRSYGFLDFLGPCIHGASLTVLVLQGYFHIGGLSEVHFPSLRNLILLEVTKEVLGFGILGQFTSIQRLICQAAIWSDQRSQVGIVEVLAALGPGLHEDGHTGHRIPCPQLHTVAVSAAYSPLDVLAFESPNFYAARQRHPNSQAHASREFIDSAERWLRGHCGI